MAVPWSGRFSCHQLIGVVLIFILNGKPTLTKENSSSVSVLSRLFSNYDQAVRPSFGEQPIEILTDIYVESFGHIEEANMEFQVFGYLRQQWIDDRLAGKLDKTVTIIGKNIKRLWLPDPFCYNARDSNLMQPDSAVHSKVSVDVQGNVLYTKGVALLASCDLDLHHFPFDSQECFLKIGSYAYPTEDIIYKWKYRKVKVATSQMAQFHYKRASLSTSVDFYRIGNFSTITVAYFFKRRLGYYLIQVYLPGIFVVALSWIVFWMDKTDMTNRMALGITTILAIMFLLGSINSTMPKVSYPKALDWYLMVSFLFAFVSLVECFIVFVVWTRGNKKKAMKETTSTSTKSDEKGTFHSSKYEVTSLIEHKDKEHQGYKIITRKRISNSDMAACEDSSFLGHKDTCTVKNTAGLIDKTSRALFPLMFLIFNIAYWSYYTYAK